MAKGSRLQNHRRSKCVNPTPRCGTNLGGVEVRVPVGDQFLGLRSEDAALRLVLHRLVLAARVARDLKTLYVYITGVENRHSKVIP